LASLEHEFTSPLRANIRMLCDIFRAFWSELTTFPSWMKEIWWREEDGGKKTTRL